MIARNTIVEAFRSEDALLRKRLAECPREWCNGGGPGGMPSLKDILGHIAFWDDFTVEFFTRKLASGAIAPAPPLDFEAMSREARRRFRTFPYGEVLGRYLEATGAIIDFLGHRWDDLSSRERHDFWTPLRHRRGHRFVVEAALERWSADTVPAAKAAEA